MRKVDLENEALIRPFGAPSPGGRRGPGSTSSATRAASWPIISLTSPSPSPSPRTTD